MEETLDRLTQKRIRETENQMPVLAREGLHPGTWEGQRRENEWMDEGMDG